MASTSWFVSEIITFSQHRGVFLSGVTYGSVPIQVELNGKINNPTAPEYIHFFFSMLAFVSDHILIKEPLIILWCQCFRWVVFLCPRWPLTLPWVCQWPLWHLCWLQNVSNCWVKRSPQRRTSCGSPWETPGTSQGGDAPLILWLLWDSSELIMVLMNTSSNQWPNGDIQPYMPEFTDGWRPPDSSPEPQPEALLSRVEAVQPAPSTVSPELW